MRRGQQAAITVNWRRWPCSSNERTRCRLDSRSARSKSDVLLPMFYDYFVYFHQSAILYLIKSFYTISIVGSINGRLIELGRAPSGHVTYLAQSTGLLKR